MCALGDTSVTATASVEPPMKPVLFLLACLICAAAAAQPNERGQGRGLGPGPGRQAREASEGEDFRQRRERMQAFRQEMLRQQEASPRRRAERDPENVERPRGLRRLTPDERQRLREEMREAYRR